MKFSRKEILVFVGIAVLFLVLRMPGIHLLYHQDEYKWPIIVNPALTAPGNIPHPPVGEFIYKTAGQTLSYDNFRLVPLFFSFINLLLLFYLVKNIAGKKAAFWGTLLFAVSFYSVLASLMVDTDGAIMPFFFLISAISYYKLKVSNFEIDETKWKWLFLLVLSIILGFLVKISFLVGISALVLDFAFEKDILADRKKVLKYLGVGIVSIISLVLVLIASRLIFPYFQLEWSVKYWKHFANSSSFLNRGWLQTFIQFAKAIMYTSPLLILPALFSSREIFKKTRPFFLFIFVGLFFYLFAFDFSIGALDRYLQFLIVPLCIISGVVFAKVFDNKKTKLGKIDFITTSIITVSIFVLQFFNYSVLPLYPKTEWISRAISLKWNFLFPFTGGSGPTGFYISFLFIALVWICSIIFALFQLKIKNIQKRALFCILVLGILYNGVFVEEYLFGKINGSPYELFENAKEFITENKDINKVVVYNDIGAYEIQKIGKYERRLYAIPQSEESYKKILTDFNGHILYINIPKISQNTFYSNYFDSCKNIYEGQDKYITAKILNCKK